jgi:CRISPR-associated endonuclease/helicase Cas3
VVEGRRGCGGVFDERKRGTLLMRGTPTTFWGKLEREPFRWHPLVHHCLDVAFCLETLLERTLLGTRLACSGSLKTLTRVQVQRLAVLAGLHDLGKCNRGFQRRSDPDLPPSERAGHIKEAMQLFQEEPLVGRTVEALKLCDMLHWAPGDGEILGNILFSSISHHGQPAPVDPRLVHTKANWGPGGELDPMQGLSQIAAALRLAFPLAYTDSPDLLPSVPAFQHSFCGLVTLADWIASDSSLFPFSQDLSDAKRIKAAREFAKVALRDLGLLTADSREALAPLPDFEAHFDFPPRPLQEAVEDLPLPEEEGSVAILEAETGSGKTEAAIRYFLRLFEAGQVDGMYFALPTRSAATQLHGRVCKALQKVYGKETPATVLAVPGYLQVDEVKGKHLPPFKVLWPDSGAKRHRGWAAENPKRYLAAPVAVGTIDQVLLSALQVRHAHMRASALSRQLLVVDEVHASDAYMNEILQRVLNTHRALGGHAFLMSATLGAEARAGLLFGKDPLPELEAAICTSYPLLSVAGAEGSRQIPVASGGYSRKIEVSLAGIAGEPEEVARRALAATRSGGRVLVLRNLVKDAVATQEALEALAGAEAEELFRVVGVPTLHHSRFARQDRILLDRALEGLFSSEEPVSVAVVSTQTIEQSLDVDFDLLLTDLCPMDVLLQRVGRVHRHAGRRRNEGFEVPRLVVLTPEERDLGGLILERGQGRGAARGPLGFGKVYEDLRILEATWRELETSSTLEIPAQCRELVERTTHPEALNLIPEQLGGRWKAHEQTIEGVRIAQTGQAKIGLIDRRLSLDDSQSRFGDRNSSKILTRLGEEDRMLRFDPPIRGPFGAEVSYLTLPEWMARGCTSDAELAEEVEEMPHGVGFRFGGASFVYDRLGLRKTED